MDQFDSDRDSLVHPWNPELAIGLLTRLPTPRVDDDVISARMADASWAWPPGQAAVALLSAVCAAVAMRFGIAPAGASLVAFAVYASATGALRGDGLADCANRFRGRSSSERRLEIKSGCSEDVYAVDALATAVERAVGRMKPVAFEVIIETATGIAHFEDIDKASPRLQTISLGATDFAASMGLQITGIGGTQEN